MATTPNGRERSLRKAAPERDAEAQQQQQQPSPASLLGNQAMNQLAGNGAASGALLGASAGVGNQAVQRLAQGEGGSGDLGSRIRDRQGSGAPLDAGLQRSLASSIGGDFSGVRVHTDSEADQMSRSVNAHAFTSGSDIYFRSGAYNPNSEDGMRTLAHEATHVVQQSQGPVAGTSNGKGVAVSDPSDRFEQAAEASAEKAVTSLRGGGAEAAAPAAAGAGAASAPVQRAEEEEPAQMRSIQRAEDEGSASEGEEPAQMRAIQRAEDEGSASEGEEPAQMRSIQRAEDEGSASEGEEPAQMRSIQRAEDEGSASEGEEPAQMRSIQRAEDEGSASEGEEALQGRFVQRAEDESSASEGEEALQGRFVQRSAASRR